MHSIQAFDSALRRSPRRVASSHIVAGWALFAIAGIGHGAAGIPITSGPGRGSMEAAPAALADRTTIQGISRPSRPPARMGDSAPSPRVCGTSVVLEVCSRELKSGICRVLTYPIDALISDVIKTASRGGTKRLTKWPAK
jgi:hypothetical protein